MYELGEESDREHKKLGELVKQNKFTQVYFCGKMIKKALDTFPEGKYYADKMDLAAEVKKQSYSNTLFLLKASRGIGLEEIINQI